jgi:protein SCO1
VSQPTGGRPLKLAPLGILLGLAVGALVLSSCGAGAPGPPPASQGIVQSRSIPAVPLINARGGPASLANYRGKYVVLAPFLTLCQDECPLVTGAFIALQQDVRAAGLAKRVVFMEITVDPGRDTPARLAAYSQRFGADWPLLTGTPANLDKLWRFFGISVQIVPEAKPPKLDWFTGKPLTYDVNHTDGFILIGPDGREKFADANPPNLHGKLNQRLTGLLNSGGIRNLDHQTGISWTVTDALTDIGWLVGRTIPSIAST